MFNANERLVAPGGRLTASRELAEHPFVVEQRASVGMGSVRSDLEVACLMGTPLGQPRQFETMGRSVTLVPLVIKRRHRSKLIVPPVGASAVKATASFDLPLIRTLGKAFYWQRMVDTGARVRHFTPL